MKKSKALYACQHCGSQFPKWQGQCADCGKWNTLVEEKVDVAAESSPRFTNYAGVQSQVTTLSAVPLADTVRFTTGTPEFDRVLGGGLVSDSVVLIGGDPGIGKSTLLLQIMTYLSTQFQTLYITGEESLQQVALRAKRLGLPTDELMMLAETCVERIIDQAKKTKPKMVVIDSIQTVFTQTLNAAPGGVSQVRESAAMLLRFAKQTGTALFLVGHVTKEGALAGPRVLEHMVDTVLYFEGQRDSRFRMIRSVKNRFGAVNELGIFAMQDTGLKAVNNPSAIFLSREEKSVPGSVVMVSWEGSRPMLVEVQALVDESHMPNPRRVTLGFDSQRLTMLLAILNRHAGVTTFDQDVFVNVVGGLRITETGIDLSVLLAVVSSLKDKPIAQDVCVFGEVGLSGEVRPVSGGLERVKEAIKLGFTTLVIPKANAPKKTPNGVEIIAVSRLDEALEHLLK